MNLKRILGSSDDIKKILKVAAVVTLSIYITDRVLGPVINYLTSNNTTNNITDTLNNLLKNFMGD